MGATRLAIIYLCLALMVLAPICAVATPGLGDYINHLARMHILANISTSPDLQRYYIVQWAPIPYLAMDAIVPLLARIMPIYLAGKLFICACLLLPVVAAATLHHVLYKSINLMPALAFLLSYNYVLSLGFLNFLFSASCAVLLFAGWLAASGWPRWWRAACFAPLLTLLYLGHVFAAFGYCLAVAGYYFGQMARAKFTPWRAWVMQCAAAAAQALPALYLALHFNMQAGYVGALQMHYGSVADKILAIASPFIFQPDPLNVAVFLAIIAALVVFGAVLRLHAHLWPAALLVFAVSLCVPHLMRSTWGTDLRLPLIAVLLALGGLRVQPTQGALLGRLTARDFITLMVVLMALKSASAWQNLHATDTEIRNMRQLLAQLPRGARLLVVNIARGTKAGGPNPSTRWNMPLLAAIDRDAFVPTLFSGLSSVHVQPQYRAASTPNGFPITLAQLRAGAELRDQPGVDVPDGPGGARLYHYGWPQKFDYVLIQAYGLPVGALPPQLQRVAVENGITLYKIVPK